MAEQGLPNVNRDLEKGTKLAKEMYKYLTQIMGVVKGTTSNGMSGSLGNITAFSRIGAGLNIAGSVAGTGYNMMPQLQDVVMRSTAFYNASMLQGGRFTQGQMYNNLRAGLGRFGIQDQMSTAILAQRMGESGVVFGSQYANQLTSAVGGAVKYLNMDTQRAFNAVQGLTAGAGGQSGTLLRSMGIFTANPYTGREYTQQQIFEQIHGRLSAGRNPASVEDVQNSYRRGSLGAFLKDSGLTPDQQQMYYMWELAKAGGVKMDLGDKNSMDAAMKQLKIKNPQLALNEIQASNETVLEKGTQSYLSGLDASVGSIQALNTAAGALAQSFGSLKSYLDSLNSTVAGSAALTAISGGISSGAGMLAGRLGGGGGEGEQAAKMGGLAKTVGVAGGVIGVAAGTGLAYTAAKQGNGWGVAGGILMSGASGALAGAMFGVPGAIVGGAVGLIAGGIGAAMGTGGPNEPHAKSSSSGAKGTHKGSARAASSGTSSWVVPANGTISSGFGPRNAEFPGMSINHMGIDIANSSGGTIKAARTGRVVHAEHGNSNFGNYVRIYHPDVNITTGYGHMSSFSVKKGDQVTAGKSIGQMGMTGIANGVHLHFSMAKGENTEQYFDPATEIPSLKGGNSMRGGGDPTTNATATASPTTSNSLVSWTTPTAIGATGTASGATTGSAGSNYGIKTSDYLSAPSGVSNVFASSTNSLLYQPGSKSANPTTNDGKGGEAAVTFLSGTAGSSSPEFADGYAATNTSSSVISRRGSSGSGNNVVINLTIAKASSAEARRFADMVKTMLENESDIAKIGKR